MAVRHKSRRIPKHASDIRSNECVSLAPIKRSLMLVSIYWVRCLDMETQLDFRHKQGQQHLLANIDPAEAALIRISSRSSMGPTRRLAKGVFQSVFVFIFVGRRFVKEGTDQCLPFHFLSANIGHP